MKIPGGKQKKILIVTDSPGAHAYMAKPEYQAAMEAAAAMGPGVSIATIYHDDWCPRLKGGVCSCDPDIGATRQLA